MCIMWYRISNLQIEKKKLDVNIFHEHFERISSMSH